MSDLENKTQEETPKKRPYNLRQNPEHHCCTEEVQRPRLFS